MRDVHARESIGMRDIALTRVKIAIVDDEGTAGNRYRKDYADGYRQQPCGLAK